MFFQKKQCYLRSKVQTILDAVANVSISYMTQVHVCKYDQVMASTFVTGKSSKNIEGQVMEASPVMQKKKQWLNKNM
jgi:hypothetical protein